MREAADMDIYHRLMPSNGDGPPGPPDPAQPGLTQAADQKSADSLTISPARLRATSREAVRLGHTTKSAQGRLEHAHEGLPSGSGFSAVGVLKAVHASWDDRLAKITKDCGEIGDLLTTAAAGHEGNDGSVRDSMRPRTPAAPDPAPAVVVPATAGARPRS